jgi:hypothetical protein
MMRERNPGQAGLGHSPFRNLAPAEWNSIFESRRGDIDYAIENKPLIAGRDLEDSVVRCFMKSKDESDACLPRSQKVEAYCRGATLDALQEEEVDVGGPNSWLDERSYAGGKEQARGYRGLLTPRSLYHELRRPVNFTEIRRLVTSQYLTYRLKVVADIRSTSASMLINRPLRVQGANEVQVNSRILVWVKRCHRKPGQNRNQMQNEGRCKHRFKEYKVVDTDRASDTSLILTVSVSWR